MVKLRYLNSGCFRSTWRFIGLTSFGWIVQQRVHWGAGIPFQFIWGIGMMLGKLRS